MKYKIIGLGKTIKYAYALKGRFKTPQVRLITIHRKKNCIFCKNLLYLKLKQ